MTPLSASPDENASLPSAVPGPARLRRGGRKLMKATAHFVAFLSFLALGLWAGPRLHDLYQRSFPAPSYVSGNYEAIYRKAGKPVVMFSKSTCPYCRRAREFLTREHVDFVEFVVDESSDARQWFDALDGRRVPLLFVGDRRIVGFREETIRQSLASAAR
jgi:glutaredoxin